MITLDSPVAAVLGDKKSKRDARSSTGSACATVGDLLRHFPRRYLKTGELTKVERPHDGPDADRGRARSSSSEVRRPTRTGAPAGRPTGVETVLRTDGPEPADDVLRQASSTSPSGRPGG